MKRLNSEQITTAGVIFSAVLTAFTAIGIQNDIIGCDAETETLDAITETETFIPMETFEVVEVPDVCESGTLEWSLEDELRADELEYLALCVAAESQGQPTEGIRLVVDTILNRVDSEDFPDTITEVINQPGQFSVVADGRINTVNPEPLIFEIVTEELDNRTNDEVLYFNAIGYREGTPMCKISAHYFSAE